MIPNPPQTQPCPSLPTLSFRLCCPVPWLLNIFQKLACLSLTSQSSKAQVATAPHLRLKKKRGRTHSGLWSADESLALYGACDGMWMGSPLGLLRLLNTHRLRSPSPHSLEEWHHPSCSGSQKYKKLYLNPVLSHSRDWGYHIPKQEK